jgi:hypothetical protein
MSTLEIQFEPLAVAVSTTTNALRVVLADGRELSVPLAWFPRLKNATEKQRSQWRLIGGGIGIHWPLVDEDISVESLLARPQLARRSGIISLTEMEKRAIREGWSTHGATGPRPRTYLASAEQRFPENSKLTAWRVRHTPYRYVFDSLLPGDMNHLISGFVIGALRVSSRRTRNPPRNQPSSCEALREVAKVIRSPGR